MPSCRHQGLQKSLKGQCRGFSKVLAQCRQGIAQSMYLHSKGPACVARSRQC